jgi:hypothetical protein
LLAAIEILVTAWAAGPEPLDDSPTPIIWRNVVLLAVVTAWVGFMVVRRRRRRLRR